LVRIYGIDQYLLTVRMNIEIILVDCTVRMGSKMTQIQALFSPTILELRKN